MEYKVCRTCNEEKPISDFSLLQKKRNSYNCDCTTCRSYKRRQLRYNLKETAIKYKGGKCLDCNGVFPFAVFEFHHLDPSTKDKDPAHLFGDKIKLSDKDFRELDKCVLLCANCHRLRHFSN